MATHDLWTDAARYQGDKIMLNKQQFSKVVTFGGIIGGTVAGLLGLEGITGFAFYFLFYVAVVATLCGVRLGMQPGKYFRSAWDVADPSVITEGLLSYILVWTIAYASIYIF